ncbi:hypothetical protein OEB94_09015 [Streptomyces sp. ICN988]|nr:hypothetical protein [Streptomyces sp. ICN988]MCV2459401.1 hypothetical protein [Streptomyces sp. ICN988]
METARPRIEEHQGEVFYTKTGKPFTYRTNHYTLVIVESRRNVQWHEIRSALEAWPIAGPSEIPRLLTAVQADMLDTGRQIRNGMAHGQATHAVMPPAMAIPMVQTS